MFHFAGFASAFADSWPPPGGFPHSDIPGSLIACLSPGRFAACCVLPRCQMPIGILRMPFSLYSLIHDAFYSVVNLRREIINLPLVEMIGFEPTTHGLQSHCSPTELHPRR